MRAHRFLVEARLFNAKIERLMEDLAEYSALKSAVRSGTRGWGKLPGGERATGEDWLIRYVELEERTRRAVQEHLASRERIVEALGEAVKEATEYDVLYQYYIQGRSLEEIAERLHYSLPGVKKIKRRGLTAMEEFLSKG